MLRNTIGNSLRLMHFEVSCNDLTTSDIKSFTKEYFDKYIADTLGKNGGNITLDKTYIEKVFNENFGYISLMDFHLLFYADICNKIFAQGYLPKDYCGISWVKYDLTIQYKPDFENINLHKNLILFTNDYFDLYIVPSLFSADFKEKYTIFDKALPEEIVIPIDCSLLKNLKDKKFSTLSNHFMRVLMTTLSVNLFSEDIFIKDSFKFFMHSAYEQDKIDCFLKPLKKEYQEMLLTTQINE